MGVWAPRCAMAMKSSDSASDTSHTIPWEPPGTSCVDAAIPSCRTAIPQTTPQGNSTHSSTVILSCLAAWHPIPQSTFHRNPPHTSSPAPDWRSTLLLIPRPTFHEHVTVTISIPQTPYEPILHSFPLRPCACFESFSLDPYPPWLSRTGAASTGISNPQRRNTRDTYRLEKVRE